MPKPTGKVSSKNVRPEGRQVWKVSADPQVQPPSRKTTTRTCGAPPERHLLPQCRWPHSLPHCPPASSLPPSGCPDYSSQWTVHPSALPACTSRRFRLQLSPAQKTQSFWWSRICRREAHPTHPASHQRVSTKETNVTLPPSHQPQPHTSGPTLSTSTLAPHTGWPWDPHFQESWNPNESS